MERISEEEIKNIFAEHGLWSLVEDISDDGDGDNLQLTKEGLEAHRMIESILEKHNTLSIENLFEEYKKLYTVNLKNTQNEKSNKKG